MINKKGLTLIESLSSMLIITLVVISLLGTFCIAKVGSKRSEHRIMAAGIIQEFMEKEIANGWSGGSYFNSDTSRVVTDSTGASVTYTISHYPEPASVLYENNRPYKIVGWQVSWNETNYGGSAAACSEKAVTYIAYR